MERAVLGVEKVKLVDGTEKEINIYDIGFFEKSKLMKKHTKVTFEKGYQYKVLDEVSVMEDVMRIAFSDVDMEQLGYNIDELYNKYFNPKSQEKKDETSTNGHKDTK